MRVVQTLPKFQREVAQRLIGDAPIFFDTPIAITPGGEFQLCVTRVSATIGGEKKSAKAIKMVTDGRQMNFTGELPVMASQRMKRLVR